MLDRDDWSDLTQYLERPPVDVERLKSWRMGRLKQKMRQHDVALCMLVNPVSMRYAVDYRNYALFMSHIPSTYLLLPLEDTFAICNGFEPNLPGENVRAGTPISYFYGGEELPQLAENLADEIVAYLDEIGTSHRRIALEYINPGIVLALAKRDIEVVDGVLITEGARVIKSEDELACIRWAMRVAEFGADKLRQALRPGVSELQLWALLNYTNLANNGDWHDGRMLASGPRINPWLQEASERKLESGDLMGFDTDMVGPMGYFADLSRTFHCGPARPTARQKQLYQFAMQEIEHNLGMLKPGVTFNNLQQNAWPVPEEFQHNAYPCIIHGVGMCDEYPNILPVFRGENVYDGELLPGMVLCIESYIGAVGETDGVKLEQQVVITEDGYELITEYPFDDNLAG